MRASQGYIDVQQGSSTAVLNMVVQQKPWRRSACNRETHVHHGFRTTASTNLNELSWHADWIERQLARVPASKVRASYNKAECLAGRRQMMQAYADRLDQQSLGAD
jgi:hypothetical protein